MTLFLRELCKYLPLLRQCCGFEVPAMQLMVLISFKKASLGLFVGGCATPFLSPRRTELRSSKKLNVANSRQRKKKRCLHLLIKTLCHWHLSLLF